MSQNETDVRHIWETDFRTISWYMEWKQLTGKTLHGCICLWLMNKSSVSCTQRSTYSQILYCALERWCMGRQTDWRGSKVHHKTELWTELMVSQWNSSGTFSQVLPHCSSATKLKFLSQMSKQPEEFIGRRIIIMTMYNDISWRWKANKKECESNVQFCFCIYKKTWSSPMSFREQWSV